MIWVHGFSARSCYFGNCGNPASTSWPEHVVKEINSPRGGWEAERGGGSQRPSVHFKDVSRIRQRFFRGMD